MRLTMREPHVIRLAAVVCVAVTSLLGCGDTGSPALPSTTPTQTATPTPTATCLPVPRLMPSFRFTADPGVPRVGDRVRLSVMITGGAPEGVYNLLGSAPEFGSSRLIYVAPVGSEVDFDLTAVQTGTARLMLSVFYTVDLVSTAYCYEQRYQTVQSDPFFLTVFPADSANTPLDRTAGTNGRLWTQPSRLARVRSAPERSATSKWRHQPQ
jgi:hypothetical protein